MVTSSSKMISQKPLGGYGIVSLYGFRRGIFSLRFEALWVFRQWLVRTSIVRKTTKTNKTFVLLKGCLHSGV